MCPQPAPVPSVSINSNFNQFYFPQMSDKPTIFPPQSQDAGAGKPGLEYKMTPEPEYIRPGYKGADKLKG